MSEPLSTNEIEDVVSSVRRLVSPEARPRPMSRDLGMDRLILTPSLRIVAEQAPNGPTIVKLETVARKARVGSKRAKPAKDADLAANDSSTPPAGVIAASGPSWGQAPTSLSEMALQAEDAEVIIGDDPAPAAKAKTVRRPVAKAAVPPRAKTPVAKPEAKAKVAAGKLARAKVDAAKPAAEAKAPPTGKSEPKPKEAKPVAAKPKPEVRPVAQPSDVTPTDQVAELLAPVADGAAVETAAPEPVLSAELAEVPVPALASQPDAFPELDTPNDDVPSHAASVLTDPNGNQISLLDEDELIQMLRRVIREELQGVLGEKITRNVRKLVRAEIARALTAQTLD